MGSSTSFPLGGAITTAPPEGLNRRNPKHEHISFQDSFFLFLPVPTTRRACSEASGSRLNYLGGVKKGRGY